MRPLTPRVQAPCSTRETPDTLETLLPAAYTELRRIAAYKMAAESPNQTLQATALVHEAWLRLGSGDPAVWKDRNHLILAAAESMRRVLVDRARKRRRIKRGGEFERVDVDLENLGRIDSDDSIVRLDEALEKFTAHAPQMAELVKLRYFAGLSIADAAAEMGISPATAKRHWAFARAWLLAELRRNG